MRKIIVSEFVTLDGVVQGPGGPEEDPSGGFTQGGWSVNYWDDQMGDAMGKEMAVPFDYLLGRRTYEIFAAHWPYAGDVEPEAAAVINNARKYVASRTLERVEWNNSVLLAGDLGDALRALKQEDGNDLLVNGSSNLVQSLLTLGLIDELRLWIFPVVVGSGKRLFGDGAVPAGLRLQRSSVSSTGVIMTAYEPAGAIDLGSFALPEGTVREG